MYVMAAGAGAHSGPARPSQGRPNMQSVTEDSVSEWGGTATQPARATSTCGLLRDWQHTWCRPYPQGGDSGERQRLVYARALQQWQAVELPCLAALLSEIASWLARVGWIGGWLHAFYAIAPTNASKRRQCNQQGSKWLHVARPFLQ